MDEDYGTIRIALATMISTRNELISIEEFESAMNEVPVSILAHLSVDDHDAIRFLADFADRTAIFWRIMAGDINSPSRAGRVLQ